MGREPRFAARGLFDDVVLDAELVADFADAGDDGLVGAGAFLDVGGDGELGQGRGEGGDLDGDVLLALLDFDQALGGVLLGDLELGVGGDVVEGGLVDAVGLGLEVDGGGFVVAGLVVHDAAGDGGGAEAHAAGGEEDGEEGEDRERQKFAGHGGSFLVAGQNSMEFSRE